MPNVTLTPGSWQTVTTTTTDTVFQNQSPREVYLLAGTVGAAGLKDGFLVKPYDGIVIASGKLVSGSTFTANALIFFMEV